MCGEHRVFEAVLRVSGGSSPRVRGTPDHAPGPPRIHGIIPACAGNTPVGRHRRHLQAGIIPACAGNTGSTSTGSTPPGDHPRVCGEHVFRRFLDFFVRGSSPRVRGTPYGTTAAPPHAGIIPACAGNTRDGRSGAGTPWDHPRVCGEHGRADGHGLQRVGIIPACAGNTGIFSPTALRRRDHPRVCGEHLWRCRSLRARWGSSPRVRGTLPDPFWLHSWIGIIPACAGNTGAWAGTPWQARDHPRVCGEHLHRWGIYGMSKGSSPRVRGTLLPCPRPPTPRGIIPACAGNTRMVAEWDNVERDHPRVCGEHEWDSPAARDAWGSSPRVRGTLMVGYLTGTDSGIIPACAGNTATPLAVRSLSRDHPRVCGEHKHGVKRGHLTTWIIPACAGNTIGIVKNYSGSGDHPRVCGEHISAMTRMDADTGSSPRVRGTLLVACFRWYSAGIIPACAGNTLGQGRASVRERDHPRVCGEHFTTPRRRL